MLQNNFFFTRPLKTPWVFEQEPGERSIGDGLTDVGHEPLEEPYIMHGNEQRAKHLACEKIVADGSTGKSGAGVAVAAGFNRAIFADKSAVSEPDRAGAGEGIGIAAIAGGQRAIEHINARRDGNGNVAGETDAHQVARFMSREHGRRLLQYRLHRLKPFAHRQAAKRITGKIQGDQTFGAAVSERRVRSPLYDAEERLIVWPCVRGDGLLRPTKRPFDGDDMILRRRGGRRAFIERHDDVGPQRILHFHAALRVEVYHAAINVAFEGDARIVDVVHLGKREDLISAAVGEDGAGPGHEPVEVAKLGDGFFTGAEHEVVSVGENTLGTGGGKMIGGDSLDGALRADRHEGGRIECAVSRGDSSTAGLGGCVLRNQFKLKRGRIQGRGRVAGGAVSRKQRISD